MSAVERLLADHIGVWTAAETEKRSGRGRAAGNAGSVYGVKKLRELILELAVRGKLVAQDAGDEPAGVLLERIRAEKAKLVAEGRIRSDGQLAMVPNSEKFFTLPTGWVWVRFGHALISRDAERIPVSSDERQLRKGEYDYYGASGVIDKIDAYLFDKPLLLIGEDGANLINRSSPIAFIARGKYWVNNHAHVLDGISEDFLRYIELFINAIDLKQYVTGTAQPKMNQAKMNSIVLGLPPEVEQKRIVAKVDELMALCDQLETAHSNAAAAHEQLVAHLLGTLTQSQNTSEFNTNWQRIAAHFDTLFTTESSIDMLKQTVLQLGVMGKLVEQDANDEPTCELLKRIQIEKARLVADGAIRQEKPFAKISKEDQDFALPMNWEWTFLGQLVLKVSDGPHFSPQYVDRKEGIAFISARNIKVDGWELDSAKYISYDDHKEFTKRTKAEVGDILYTKGGTTGVARVNDLDFEFSVWVHVAVLNLPKSEIFNHYLALALNSPHCYTQSQKFTHGSTNKDLGLTRLIHIAVPLPPLREQHRIVAKVNELMALCDQLKARITAANQCQLQLAEALVTQAVA